MMAARSGSAATVSTTGSGCGREAVFSLSETDTFFLSLSGTSVGTRRVPRP
jgi:hypothetical protein